MDVTATPKITAPALVPNFDLTKAASMKTPNSVPLPTSFSLQASGIAMVSPDPTPRDAQEQSPQSNIDSSRHSMHGNANNGTSGGYGCPMSNNNNSFSLYNRLNSSNTPTTVLSPKRPLELAKEALVLTTDSLSSSIQALSPRAPSDKKKLPGLPPSIPHISSGGAGLRLNKFVRRLHDMLQAEKDSGVVEWRRGLLVLHSTDAFAKTILPKYFNTRNFKTFRRQLNYYGFVHVRSFSTTGSTTTALWVNRDLAKMGSAEISSVLLLKRVEPCEAAKTAEGRRVRKEMAIFTVEEDIGVSPKTLQMEQIRSLAIRAGEDCALAAAADPTGMFPPSVIEVRHSPSSAMPPAPAIAQRPRYHHHPLMPSPAAPLNLLLPSPRKTSSTSSSMETALTSPDECGFIISTPSANNKPTLVTSDCSAITNGTTITTSSNATTSTAISNSHTKSKISSASHKIHESTDHESTSAANLLLLLSKGPSTTQ